jgi:hypothetical protein
LFRAVDDANIRFERVCIGDEPRLDGNDTLRVPVGRQDWAFFTLLVNFQDALVESLDNLASNQIRNIAQLAKRTRRVALRKSDCTTRRRIDVEHISIVC